ncbi:TerC family protein [Virgibacillus dakarensis]|uniref:TerC family protein n=1 Tax=Bacillaceae TaxID=186817 RepID=UPI000B443FC4|nr:MULTISPECIES: TerC family protein [Bacillaceae]MBT2217332.1 TerC family protein [Virgibacillus dakarensis]
MEFTSESIIALLKIIAIDIVLSGDNAIVIALATRRLPKKRQNKAIILGTGGAVILRIIFAIVIVYLLQIPLVHLIGGLLLLYIAHNVLIDDKEEANVQSSSSLGKAVMTIIMADAVMSLDNVVAVAGAAKGHIGMIALGVAVSIPIMIFGSKVIVRIMEKYTWIAYIGAGILAWTAGEMITEDDFVTNTLQLEHGPFQYAIIVILTIGVLLSGYVQNKNTKA